MKQDIKHKEGLVLWLTGLSGAGKSTIANGLSDKLNNIGIKNKVLDGDDVRMGICSDLGFTIDDRFENIRRIAEISKLFIESDFVVIVAAITPKQKMREMAANIIGRKNYVEVFIDASIQECEKRDTKGLYAKAKSGEITNFTGVSASYQKPENAALTINTELLSVKEAIDKLFNYNFA